MEDDVLPNGWAWASLGDITDFVRHQVVPSDQPEKYFNYLSIENIESNTGRLVGFAPTRGDDIRSAKLAFTTRDMLYSRLRPYLNKVHLPTFDGISATDLLPIRPKSGISREFVAQFLRTRAVVQYAKQRMRGIQLPRLAVGDLGSLRVPVPPSSEQRRISVKIGHLFQELSAAKQALHRIPPIMKRFRRSVLSKAFRGELTERDSSYRPAEELLQQVRERRTRREREGSTKWFGDAIHHGNRFRDFVTPNDSLPEGWLWTNLGELTESSFYGPRFAKGDYRNTGVITIRTTDIDEYGRLSLHNPPRIQLNGADIARFGLQEGDLLITRSGSIGKCTIFRGVTEPAIPSAYLIRFRLFMELVSPEYVLYYLLSKAGQDLLHRGSTAVTQSNLNAETIKMFPVPLSSRTEQERIISKLYQLMELADTVGVSAVMGETSAFDIEQSILAKAFRGELVPQEPADEPATELLHRLKPRA